MAQQIDMIRNLINHIVYKKVRWNITKCTVLLKKYWDPKSTNWCHLWTIVIKLVLEFSQSSPPFLLYILAPNKIKRPILRIKGTAHSGPFGLLLSKKCYAFLSSTSCNWIKLHPISNMYVGFCHFVVYNPKWSYNFISLLEKRDMTIYGQNFAISSYSVLGTRWCSNSVQ